MHLFHKWSKWIQYEEQGVMTKPGFFENVQYKEAREYRKCIICHAMQDRFVKQGSLPMVKP